MSADGHKSSEKKLSSPTFELNPMASEPSRLEERPRVLILAYTCIPERGSEPGMGWNRAVESAKHFDTWVLCQERLCAKAVAAYTERHGRIPGLHFVFLPESPLERALLRIPGMVYLAFNLWNHRAARLAQRLHAEHGFSLVHQLIFSGFREPGYLWKLPTPFVWGPIGGAQNYPWRFLAKAGPKTAIQECARSLLNLLQLRCSVRVRRAARRATLLMAATTTNQQAFARAHGVTPLLFPDTGVRDLSATVRTPHDDDTLRILWCGVLEPRKALHLLLEALAQLSDGIAWELHVLGSGPLRARWERLAKAYGIDEHVRWFGTVPHQEALAQFAWADVFVFSSLRDTTGTVLFEALAAGLPVVCLNHQGAADVIDRTCGIKIPVTHPREVVAALAQSIERLSRDPQLREQLGQGAQQRIRSYLWAQQGERMAELYRRVIGANATAGVQSEAVIHVPSDGNGSPRAPSAKVAEPTPRSDLVAPSCPVADRRCERSQEIPSGNRSFGLGRFRMPISHLAGRGARTGFLALVDQAIVSGMRFLTTILIGRLCGASELGIYALAFSLMLAAVAAQESLLLGPYIVLGSRLRGARKASYVGSVLVEAAVLTVLTVGVLMGAAVALAAYSGNTALASTIGVLAAAIPFVLLHQLGRRFVSAELDMRNLLRLDVATAAVQLCGLAILVAGGTLSAPAVYSVVGVACALPGIIWFFKRRQAALLRWSRVGRDVRRNWRVGRWMFASEITHILSASATGWILALMLGVSATGIFAACVSLLHMTNPMLLGLSNILLPRTALALADGGHAELRRVSRKAALVFVGLGLATFATLILFGRPILATVYGPSFAAYHHVIGILALSMLLDTAGLAPGHVLVALERSDLRFLSDLAYGCTMWVAIIALIPHFGIMGAALGSLAGSVVATSLRLGAYALLTHPVQMAGRGYEVS